MICEDGGVLRQMRGLVALLCELLGWEQWWKLIGQEQGTMGLEGYFVPGRISNTWIVLATESNKEDELT